MALSECRGSSVSLVGAGSNGKMRTEAFPNPEPLRSAHHLTVQPSPTIDCAFPERYPKVAVITPSVAGSSVPGPGNLCIPWLFRGLPSIS